MSFICNNCHVSWHVINKFIALKSYTKLLWGRLFLLYRFQSIIYLLMTSDVLFALHKMISHQQNHLEASQMYLLLTKTTFWHALMTSSKVFDTMFICYARINNPTSILSTIWGEVLDRYQHTVYIYSDITSCCYSNDHKLYFNQDINKDSMKNSW